MENGLTGLRLLTMVGFVFLALGGNALLPSQESAQIPATTVDDAIESVQGRSPGWNVGYEHVILMPFFEREAIFKEIDSPLETEYSNSWDLKYNPRIWFGKMNEQGLGWRFTYFNFDHNSLTHATSPNALEASFIRDSIGPDVSSDVLSITNRLSLDTMDFESFNQFDVGGMRFSLGGGLRYAHLAREYTALTDLAGEFIEASQSFDGLGPAIRFEAVRKTRRGFSMFGNARGSLMFGRESESVSGTDGGSIETLERLRHYTVLPIMETQIGFQWQSCIGQNTMTLRAGVESQLLVGGGGWDFTNDDDDGGAQWAGDAGSFGLFGLVMSAAMDF